RSVAAPDRGEIVVELGAHETAGRIHRSHCLIPLPGLCQVVMRDAKCAGQLLAQLLQIWSVTGFPGAARGVGEDVKLLVWLARFFVRELIGQTKCAGKISFRIAL